MRTVTVSRWTLPAIGAAMVAVAALAITMQPAQAADTMLVHIKQASLSDHAADCPGGVVGAHIVINQIVSAPSSIEVDFADGTSQTVSLAKQSGTVGHYNATSTSLVTDATAMVPTDWTGQFVLSNYICGSTPTSPPTSSSPPPTS
jgi:hypothetical protein